MVFMTQLIPSGTFNFPGQLKSLVYSAISDPPRRAERASPLAV